MGGAGAAHASEEVCLAEAMPECPPHVLGAAVRIQDRLGGLGSSAPACDLECIDDAPGLEVVRDREADDPARVNVDHDGRLDPAE